MTRVVIVGSGGREHALASALGRASGVTEVMVTPGNDGIPGSTETPPQHLEADLFIIGPEARLVGGLADELRHQGKAVVGPGADGAKLEGSKVWMKRLLDEAVVPTGRWQPFNSVERAERYLKEVRPPYVIKTDGLAGGHGVLVTESLDEAAEDLRRKLGGQRHKGAGRMVVVEEGLVGRELSVMAICDGRRAVLLPTARDYKRLLDDDKGPNTGGMGAYSPVADAPPDDVLLEIIEQTLAALRHRGIDYRGILYAGLMLTAEGPMVLEYNVRFGDPEAQVVLPRVTPDSLLACLQQAAEGNLTDQLCVSPEAAVTVAMVTKGYPAKSGNGCSISGIEQAERLPHTTVYHGGTARTPAGWTTAGGRVVFVTGRGPSLSRACTRAYAGASHISWSGVHYRKDIALG